MDPVMKKLAFTFLLTLFSFSVNCMELKTSKEEVGRAIQPNGKTTVLKISRSADNSQQLTIYRIMPDGSRDISFGMSDLGFPGTLIFPFSGHPDIDVKSVDVQIDGKILITMIRDDQWNGKELILTRLNDTGLDMTFGSQGMEIYNLNASYKEKLL